MIYIKRALGVVKLEGAGRLTDGQIEKLLEDAAEDLIEDLALQRVRDKLTRKLRKAIEIHVESGKRTDDQLAAALSRAANAVSEIDEAYGRAVAEAELENAEQEFRAMWSDGLWKEKFPGRGILKGLCEKLGGNVQYSVLRNAIVGEMAKDGYQPEGMVKVMDRVSET